MVDAAKIRRAVSLLQGQMPHDPGPVLWSISEDSDGCWMIVFSGSMSGAMHPRTFCDLVIEQLNEDA